MNITALKKNFFHNFLIKILLNKTINYNVSTLIHINVDG